MAISHDGNFGLGAASAAGTTLTITPTGTIAVGKAAVIVISCNNVGTTDADFSEVTSVTDTGSNTWKKCREYTNGQTAAAAGVTCSVWRCLISTELTVASTVTITLANSIADRCATLEVFTVVTGLVPVKSTQNATDGSNGFGSAAISSLTSAEYLFLRGLAKEANSTTDITVTTDYTLLTGTRSRNNSAATLVRGEFRIVTATTETSNPTLAVSGDTAACFIAFSDAAENAESPSLVQYASFGGTSAGTTLRNWPLPNAVLSGNTVIVGVQCSNAQTPTVTDDQSGTYTVVGNIDDTGNSQRAYIAYRTNVTDAPTVIKVDPVAALTYVSGWVTEWKNIDAADPFDSAKGTTFSSTSGAPGNIVTSADNDLILTYCVEDSVDGYGTNQAITSWTVPTSFSFVKSDRWVGDAAGYRVLASAGSSNPSWTLSPSRNCIVLQAAFRAASQGTAPTASPRVIGVVHQGLDYLGNHATPFVLQIPFADQGDTFYAAYIGLRDPGAMTDSIGNTWTATGASVQNTSGGNSGFVRCYYTFNPTLSQSMTLSIAYTGLGSLPGDTCMFYEAIGLNTFDVHGSGTVAGTGTSFQVGSITPLKSDGIVFTTAGESDNTSLSVDTGVFIPSTDPNEETSPWYNDENNAWSFYNNPNTTAVQPTFTTDAASGATAWISDAFGFEGIPYTPVITVQSQPVYPKIQIISY